MRLTVDTALTIAVPTLLFFSLFAWFYRTAKKREQQGREPTDAPWETGLMNAMRRVPRPLALPCSFWPFQSASFLTA
jgi:hypothetical protein